MDWRRPQDGKTSLGTASISASLIAAGVQVNVIDETINSSNFCKENFLKRILEHIKGDDYLIGFGVYVWNDHEVKYLIHKLRAINKLKLMSRYSAIEVNEATWLECTNLFTMPI